MLYTISTTLPFSLLYNPTSVHRFDVNITSAPIAKYNCVIKPFASEESLFEAAELLCVAVRFSIGILSDCIFLMLYSKAD